MRIEFTLDRRDLEAVAAFWAGNNRMHMDSLVADVAREVVRLESLGATRVTPVARPEFGQTWLVLADPEATSSASHRSQEHRDVA